MKTIPIQIRCSAIPELADCQRRAAAKLLRSQIIERGYHLHDETQGIAAAVGTAVHAGCAYMLQGYIDRGELNTVPAAIDIAISVLREYVTPQTTYDWTTPHMAAGEQQVQRMMAAYEPIAMTLRPTHVETEIVGTIAGVSAIGHYDNLCAPGQLRDIKTGKPRSYDLQLAGYAELLSQNGQPIATAHIDYIPRTGMRYPQPAPWSEQVDVIPAKPVAERLVRQFADAAERFETTGDANEFTANPASRLCTAEWCVAFGTGTADKQPFCKLGRVHEKPQAAAREL